MYKDKKMIKLLVIVSMVMCLMPVIVLAHGGGTDSSGGHHDYNNVSGLGDYHYHHGYGPHLHESGVCPYDDGATSTVTYSSYSEDEYEFTEDELFDYVYEEVSNNPSAYNVVSLSEYEELQEDYEFLKNNSISTDEANDNVLMGVGITGGLGILACYLIYRRYN